MIKLFKNNNKNIAIFTILTILILSSLTGCSSKKETVEMPSVKEIDEAIREDVDISNMVEGDKDKLKKFYDINSDKLEEFVVYTPSTNIEASEMAIIKVKDSKNLKDIETKISKRIEEQASSFKDYMPEEYYLIEKHILKTKENYILYVVSENADEIETIFDESFRKQN